MRYLALLLLVLVLLGCSSPKLAIQNDPIDPARPTLMVAVLKDSHTPFKQELIDRLRQDYSDSLNVVVREVKKPQDIAGEEYSALLVMETLKAWLWFNGGLKKFAARPDQSRTVYFVSVGDEKWRWKRDDLTVLTAATQKVKAADTYPQLRRLLDPLLQP